MIEVVAIGDEVTIHFEWGRVTIQEADVRELLIALMKLYQDEGP